MLNKPTNQQTRLITIPAGGGNNMKHLEALKLTTLEKRRLRGDLIEVFKLLMGRENIDHTHLFQLDDTCYIYIFIHQMMVATTTKIIGERKENLTKLNYNNYIYARRPLLI